MGHYIELTKENFTEHTQSGVALVDFWAPWCGPCRMLSPVIDKLAEEYEGKAKICKVNTDEQEELSSQFGIRSIPTMLFFKDGQVVDQMVGATSEQALKDKLNALL
ncbi:thioredoxin [Helicobacter cholecystus]|uniref:Thioredoxin n=1 Tax=Helicobacter cholecystus TaxID=45498 RepID=A0A3D8IVQ2_9HELI|nr:thioredoxin [Helicobacter cholecystus]RDU69080.1 thioredoxin [Helicobacter cholecystus]VEJ24612.1 thioredoxin [Helicobacter cholecystus]